MTKIERLDEQTLSTLTQYTLPQMLAKQARELGSQRTAIREKNFGIWQTYNWNDYLQYTKKVALGLASLGLKRGENIGIITNNHPEWLFTELGAQALGAITLNLFTTAVAKELAFGLNRVQAAYIIAEDQEQVDKLLEVREELPFVRKVIYIDPTGMRTYTDNPWLMSFQELLELGADFDRKSPNYFTDELNKGKPDEVALMIMTSGTTGLPKLSMITHENFTEISRKWLETAPIGIGDNWISITPPAWIVDQMWGMGVTLSGGMIMNFPETIETVVEDYRDIGPTVIITASWFWEDLASKIRVKISDSGFIKRLLFKTCMRIGGAVVDRESQKKEVPLYLKSLYWISSRIMFTPLMDRVGGLQFRGAYTGGHPISPDVIRFFRANGINLKQCYGLTESGGIFQVQPDDEVKLETVGVPLPRT
ncbi:MAG: long-chain fatty acid--CoA ligase, partial [Deltaproteobacteria bacterium]